MLVISKRKYILVDIIIASIILLLEGGLLFLSPAFIILEFQVHYVHPHFSSLYRNFLEDDQ